MRKMCWFLLLALATPTGAASLSPAVQRFVRVAAPVVDLTHVRVIDGTGAPAREGQTLVLRDDRIESVGPAAGATVPAEAQVLDLHGAAVLPGLVGRHDHLFHPAGGWLLAGLDPTGIGGIAAGKQADLVVVRGDPSTRIDDIENVEVVFRDGVGYDSAELIESVRGLVGTC